MNVNTDPFPRSFHYENLTITLHPEVYEPAEDTYFLLEAIQIKKHDTVFEIGTGCGIIALACGCKGAHVVCSDVNPYAVNITKQNVEHNSHHIKGTIDVRYGDMFEVIKPNEVFDIIVFNPPYLPLKPQDCIGGTGWLDIATNGGVDGLELIRKFIDGLPQHLRKNGHGYFIYSSFSNKRKLEKYLSSKNLTFQVVLSRWLGEEKIDIYRVKYR